MPEYATITITPETLLVVILFAVSAYIVTIGNKNGDHDNVIDDSGNENEDEEGF